MAPFTSCPSKRCGPRREAPPLGARSELVQAPSATLWLQWRTTAPEARLARMLTWPIRCSPEARPRRRHEKPRCSRASDSAGCRMPEKKAGRSQRHVGGVEALVGENASEKA